MEGVMGPHLVMVFKLKEHDAHWGVGGAAGAGRVVMVLDPVHPTTLFRNVTRVKKESNKEKSLKLTQLHARSSSLHIIFMALRLAQF